MKNYIIYGYICSNLEEDYIIVKFKKPMGKYTHGLIDYHTNKIDGNLIFKGNLASCVNEKLNILS